ncbi:MAG: hypothetical protein N3I35_06430 [Clostridia bacterium]|nr:hypothetical protein [Clostridia bacterium]
MDILNRLLECEPYVQYAVRKNILRQNKNELSGLKTSVLSDIRIYKYLNDIVDFNATLVTNHKNPDIPIHKLLFLLEVGLDTDVPQIDMVIQQILKNKDENGFPKSMTNIPKHFGGSGEDTLDIIETKANSKYQFIPESVYQKCKEWDFGQKKQPS